MGNNLQSSSDISSWSSNEVYSVREFFVHEGWTARQTLANRKGDGDVLGVDIAIAVLDQNVMDIIRSSSGANEEPLNKGQSCPDLEA